MGLVRRLRVTRGFWKLLPRPIRVSVALLTQAPIVKPKLIFCKNRKLPNKVEMGGYDEEKVHEAKNETKYCIELSCERNNTSRS